MNDRDRFDAWWSPEVGTWPLKDVAWVTWQAALKAQPTTPIGNGHDDWIKPHYQDETQPTAEAVREACAKVCDDEGACWADHTSKLVGYHCAAAIRALDLTKLGGRDE